MAATTLLLAEQGLNHFDGGAGDDIINTLISNFPPADAADVIDGGADTDLLQLDAEFYSAGASAST